MTKINLMLSAFILLMSPLSFSQERRGNTGGDGGGAKQAELRVRLNKAIDTVKAPENRYLFPELNIDSAEEFVSYINEMKVLNDDYDRFSTRYSEPGDLIFRGGYIKANALYPQKVKINSEFSDYKEAQKDAEVFNLIYNASNLLQFVEETEKWQKTNKAENFRKQSWRQARIYLGTFQEFELTLFSYDPHEYNGRNLRSLFLDYTKTILTLIKDNSTANEIGGVDIDHVMSFAKLERLGIYSDAEIKAGHHSNETWYHPLSDSNGSEVDFKMLPEAILASSDAIHDLVRSCPKLEGPKKFKLDYTHDISKCLSLMMSLYHDFLKLAGYQDDNYSLSYHGYNVLKEVIKEE